MKKSFYWSVAFIAALVFAGVYSTNVLAQENQEDSQDQDPAPIVDQAPASPENEEESTEPTDSVEPTEPTEPTEPVEPTDLDADEDGVNDDVDNCPADANADQADADADGEGDVCEEPASPEVLGDSTGSGDDTPVVEEPKKDAPIDPSFDWSNLTEEDALDGDFDNDGVSDEEDNCLIIPNKDQADEDGNDIGDACEEAGFGAGSVETEEDAPVMVARFAFPSDPDVELCHYDDGEYEYVVDGGALEIVALLHALLSGHSQDIIEPFNFGFFNILFYPGKNWTPENEEFLANGCEPVTKLTVIKNVDNAFGGTLQSSDFNLNVTWYTGNSNDESDPWRGFAGSATGTTFDVEPGNFLVGEDWVPGYSMVIDTNAGPRCAGGQTLNDGEHLTCTVTNKHLAYGGNDEPMCELEGEGWYGEYFNYPKSREDMYSIYEADPVAGDDGLFTMKWGQPINSGDTAHEWYDVDGAYFRFSRVDSDLEFGDMFWPFYDADPLGSISDPLDTDPGLVEEETYGGDRDFNFGVHWSATVDVPSDATPADYYTYGKFDDDVFVYVNGVLDVDSSATGVHGPVAVTGTLNLKDGDVIDVYYADRAQGESSMYLEFINNTDETKGNEIFFAPYNDDCNLVCDPQVNLIKNGGFENPELSNNSWSIFTSPTALLEWLTGSEGIEIQNYAAGTPFAGEQLAELDPNHPTTIWQDIPTILGVTYRLETQYSPRPGRDAEDNRFEFRVDGSAVGASIARDGSANGDTVWTLESRTFVASSTMTSVGFAEIGTDTSYGAYLDEVALYCIPEVVEDPELTLDKSGVYNEETGTITFTLDWSVTGEGTIYDVTITDPVPAGTTFVSADNGGFLSGSDVVWNLGNQVAVASGSVSFTVALDEVAAIGFYADNYSNNLQGTRKDGSPINVDRTDPTDALGAPQSAGLSNDAPVVAGSFFALGFSQAPTVGGSIILTFSDPVMNGAGNDLKVFEVTGGTYPDETVQVEAWDIGTASWVNLGNVTRDGEVDLGSVLTTTQIRLTDVSTKALFPNDGDAYDLDALQAYYTAGSVCSINNTATIGGSEEGEVYPTLVAKVYDQDGYDFYASASTTVMVNEKACEPGDDDDDDDDDTTITVNKVINVESSQEFNFFLDGSESAFATLNGGETSGPVGVTPGSHSVGEGLVEGWNLTDITCLNEAEEEVGSIDGLMYLTLEDGDDIICTFTNTFQNGGNDETPNDTPNDDSNGRSGSNRNSFRGRGEVLGATTDTNFCPFLRDYQHINTENDPSEVNKAKAFFNSYLGLNLLLNGVFDMPMFNAVVQFQNMFKPDVLDTWTEEFPSLDDNATGYLYQTTKWKINSIICPGYETFPDQLIMAPGTTVN